VNERQRFRQAIAENGLEKTPSELDELIDSLCLPFHLYKQFLALDDEDIRIMAEECGDTYEFAKEVVDVSLYIGHLKWGDDNTP